MSISSPIVNGELIGRRIFHEKLAAVSSMSDVPANVFLDTRYEEDLSVDRLGTGNVTKAIVKELTRLADEAATLQKTNFLGWIANHRKNIKQTEVRPDPLTIAIDGIENPYHGLIDRSGVREKVAAHHFSRSLLFMFQEGQIVHPIRSNATN